MAIFWSTATRCKSHRGLLLLASVQVILAMVVLELDVAQSVIVDGSKKKEISPLRHQSRSRELIETHFNEEECGQADVNKDEHEFINMAREGQFPWIVSFQIKTNNGLSDTEKDQKEQQKLLKQNTTVRRYGYKDDLHFCCGSIIKPTWILSAAHCFNDPLMEKYLHQNRLNVVSGSHKVLSRDKLNLNSSIARIYIHSSFDKRVPIGFDIALVELDVPLKLSRSRKKTGYGEQSEPFMNSICLPNREHKIKFNDSARIAGWGLSLENDETSMPSKLLVTDILINKTEKCLEDYVRELHSEKPRQQHDRYDDFFCANYKNTRDACQSDSGGPLMQFADDKAVAIGIVSYGIGCATQGVPGIYTRTSSYLNWIQDIVESGKDSSVAYRMFERKANQQSSVSKPPQRSTPSFEMLDDD